MELHRRSLAFPRHEQWELASQLRRSSKSIPVNLAEGMGRQMSSKDVVRFVRNALGSCDETRVWLEYARDLGYLDGAGFDELHERYCEVGRMLNGLIRKWMSR